MTISPPVSGTDPRTGAPLAPVAEESTTVAVDAVVRAADRARSWLSGLGRGERARLLRGMAERLEGARQELCGVADRETGLGRSRLQAELTRTVFQLSFFAEVVEDGGYLEASVDRAADTAAGRRPDLRRMLVPTGVVAVFGASNFPFAFSAPGGDTASALAAGCPVVLKAHGSHPGTSALAHELLVDAVRAAGGPAGTVGILHGVPAGVGLVSHPLVTAVGFTGSLAGARALMDSIHTRPQGPIPFYGELSSLNPVVVTRAAAQERAEEIGTGLAGSVTGSAGQLCTKPGLALVPHGAEGDRVVTALSRSLRDIETVPLLNERIHASYVDFAAWAAGRPELSLLAAGRVPGNGFHVAATAYEVQAASLEPASVEECFGPVVLVVRYADAKQARSVLSRVPRSLSATIQHGVDDPELPGLVELLTPSAGRLVFNGFPTGVAVSWSQHHGGPWPATNSLHSSVGATAIRRFLRPVAWQDAPQCVLPEELRDGPVDVPRRVDGVLQLPGQG